MDKDIYRRKQEWLERIMASNLTPEQKVFAYAIFKRAYGVKLNSYPATWHLEEDTSLARSKFPSHRRALFDCGALSGVKSRRGAGRQENYTYWIELDWSGDVPS